MSFSAFRYTWLTYRRDQLWFPLAIFLLFVFLILFLPAAGVRFNLLRAYLGFILPLVGGITAAYAVLDDPALELRFSTPLRASRTLLSRVGLIVAIQVAAGLLFQLVAVLGNIDVAALGGPVARQLAWLTPTLALIAVGTFGALAGARTATGAFLAGASWLVQLTMRSWFEANLDCLFLFKGIHAPGSPGLASNQGVLLALAALLFWLSTLLLERQERYL